MLKGANIPFRLYHKMYNITASDIKGTCTTDQDARYKTKTDIVVE